VPWLDDHVSCGGDIDEGALPGVPFQQPGRDWYVVLDVLVVHGDGALELEQVGGAAVIVRERAGLGVETRVVLWNWSIQNLVNALPHT
jgi:hypothetical protein